MSEAIKTLHDLRQQRADLQDQIDHEQLVAQRLRERYRVLEAEQGEADAAVAEATDALTAAIAIDPDSPTTAEARAALQVAVRNREKGSARVEEIHALQAAEKACAARCQPLAHWIVSIHEREKALLNERLREMGGDLGRRYRSTVENLAALLAEGQALNLIAVSIDAPMSFAPTVPSVITPGVGIPGQIVIHLDERRNSAIAQLKTKMADEGFTFA